MVRPLGTGIYNKEKPEELQVLMSQGKLDCEIYAIWGISKKTFYKWIQDHEDFHEAYEIGLASCEAYYVDLMRRRMEEGDDKGFKYCAMLMNNKFGYARGEGQQSVKNTQININNMNVLSNKSDAELLEFINSKLLTVAPETSLLLEKQEDDTTESPTRATSQDS